MMSEPWRVFLAAARQESRALRLRSTENKRARRYRERVA